MPKYEQQKVTIDVDEKYTELERKAIATEIIDFIVERTQKGKDKDNNKFKPYSKSYKESLDFKIAGKGKTVDLTLTEEMLNELKLIKTTKGKIEIGFDGRRNKLNGKVEGNRLGTYGQKKATVKGGRDFLGIHKDDLEDITDKYPVEDKIERIKRLIEVAAAQEAGEKILNATVLAKLESRLEDEE